MNNLDLPEFAIFEISKGLEGPAGSTVLVFDVNSIFKEWFKNLHGLKRWSNKRFKKVLRDSFMKHGIKHDIKIITNWVDDEDR